jgi:benzodiazapine receptor
MLKALNSLGMLLFLVVICLALGQIGDTLTTDQAFNWYNALQKPVWTPPSIAFPIITTVLYVFMAISAWLVWIGKKPGYQIALILWGVQLLLNAAWLPIFFGQQDIFYGLLVLDALWVFVLATMIIFYKHSKLAAFLMFLSLLWVTYAGVLNFTIWQMNA